ncbi:uncharacterized protein A1O5_01015 [Cladophialophora psammophila CBS 110553]|uniref:Uncharacterized protein n=1 Tax=Cladophialophora psammophila CBS 110553 TaxID=1182543 RepID=W9X7Q2_9EURO|nr:uncharacterized protein A1O5_01015 [Cladophialophora psammophila CBS 110553]EXJ76507.1 hypothetical protein A1O5_01015 [Cladophialophora psammophila CBS 110553]
MRQFLPYHQIPTDSATACIIFAGIGKGAERLLGHYISCCGRNEVFDPVEVHLVLLSSVTATWRPYMGYLDKEVSTQADRAILTDLNGDGVEMTQLEERQYLKQLEDALDEAAAILEHTTDTADTVHKSFMPAWPNITRNIPFEILDHGFQEVIQGLRHYGTQTETLRNKVKSASDLVTYFSWYFRRGPLLTS